MCTVTFIPSKRGVFLVSNRDEKHYRSDALAPDAYPFQTGEIVFPRDADAGGTWIAMHENGNAIVFLNGGLESHQPQPPYRKSRGLILLELVDSEKPVDTFQSLGLDGIEPFTAVVWDSNRLHECIWDGAEKYLTEKDNRTHHIWSSVTLYPEDIRAKRRQWFTEWLAKNGSPTLDDVLDFHQFTGDGDAHNDLMMNRDGHVFTVSITGMELTDKKGTMEYLDMKNRRRIYFEKRFSSTQIS